MATQTQLTIIRGAPAKFFLRARGTANLADYAVRVSLGYAGGEQILVLTEGAGLTRQTTPAGIWINLTAQQTTGLPESAQLSVEVISGGGTELEYSIPVVTQANAVI